MPSYAYELEEAVQDRYLVPPKLLSFDLKFAKRGIKYDDLSDEEKEQWEMTEWDDDGTIPDRVETAAANEWLFNKDTVDKVLKHLMEAVSKSTEEISFFAKNHQHAQFIQERFDANYAHLRVSLRALSLTRKRTREI